MTVPIQIPWDLYLGKVAVWCDCVNAGVRRAVLLPRRVGVRLARQHAVRGAHHVRVGIEQMQDSGRVSRRLDPVRTAGALIAAIEIGRPRIDPELSSSRVTTVSLNSVSFSTL